MKAIALPLSSLTAQPVGRLEVVDVDDYRVVIVNGHRVAEFRRDDQVAERLLITQLAEVSRLTNGEVASAFGIHANSVSRFRAQARSQGYGGLIPLRPGPRGPHKLTVAAEQKILLLRREGMSMRVIAERVSTSKRKISHMMVARVLRQRSAEEPQPLPLSGPEGRLEREPEEPATLLQPGETRRSRYAGALMLFAALGRLEIWEVLNGLGAQVGSWRRFGLAQTVASLVFCFALRFRSIEDLKNVRREDFGVLLNLREGPSVQTLRVKLHQLSEGLEPQLFIRELMKRYLKLEPVWEGLYYVDGHFCPYYGHHVTPRGWAPQKRMAVPGRTDVYVHDVRGRALFLISQPLNDSLVRAIPRIVNEIRLVHGKDPFTLVFDRGGFSGKLFKWLNSQDIGFLTYLKGRKARRKYPENLFERSWFEFEGFRQVYQVYEKKTRLSEVGLVRTIVYRDDQGEQIPILSNLSHEHKPAKLIHCLRARWRQENALKFMKENFAIDQIIQYGAKPEEQEHRIANPKRKKLKGRIAILKEEIEALEAKLGRSLEHTRSTTTKGLKISQADLRRELRTKHEVLNRLQTRLRHTPGMISVEELDDGRPREFIKEDRRLVVNTLKMVAYNAERLLAFQFNRHYKNDNDVLSIFRSLLHLSGSVTVSPTRIDVRLERPNREKVATALQSFLQDLNAERTSLFAAGPRLHFNLEG